MTIKAVIFDCDGTLVDSEYFHYLSWQRALQKFGGDLTLEDYYSYVGNAGMVNAKLLSLKVENLSPDLLLKEKQDIYQKLSEQGLPPIESTVQFLKSLLQEKERLGLKIGVCSAAKKKELLSHLRHLKIKHLLDITLSGHEDLVGYFDPEGVNKPKPYIYLHASKILGISPSECVVIEDSAPGVTAGVDAGCFTIAVPNDYTRNHNFSHASIRIESFANMSVDQFFKIINLN